MNIQYNQFVNEALRQYCRNYLVLYKGEWCEFDIRLSFYVSSGVFPEQTYSAYLLVNGEKQRIHFNSYDSCNIKDECNCYDNCDDCDGNLCKEQSNPFRFLKSGFVYDDKDSIIEIKLKQ